MAEVLKDCGVLHKQHKDFAMVCSASHQSVCVWDEAALLYWTPVDHTAFLISMIVLLTKCAREHCLKPALLTQPT